MIPTIEQVINYYQTIARAERMKCGRPCETTVKNAVRGAHTVCKAAGIPLDASVERLTRKALDEALIKFLEQKTLRLSAWSYVNQLRAVFAKWTLAYYKDNGWEIPKLEMPSFRTEQRHYERPTRDILQSVKAWYEKLEREAFESTGDNRDKEREWLVVTMMLEFAMRNGDVLRLLPKNFIEQVSREDRLAGQGKVTHYLSYIPHKTEHSSGRRVCWPIHETLWEKMRPLVTDGDKPDSALLRTIDSGVFERINRQMRLLGFVGGKGAYELRKICVDHIYQNYGAENATSISGDDIKTVSKYYADPSAVSVTGIRIINLL